MTKRKNILQKFGSFYNRLDKTERRQLIDLMSCWRGPDDSNSKVKTNTSAKIRAYIMKYVAGVTTEENCGKTFIQSEDFGSTQINREPLTLNNVHGNEDKAISPHFSGHMKRAYEILEDLGEL